MNDDDVFNKCTSELGGRFEASESNLFNAVRTSAESAFEVNFGGLINKPLVHFDFINNNSFNAFAFKANGKYFVGINTGLVFFLKLFFDYLMSRNDLFEDIGDISKEDYLPALDFKSIRDLNVVKLFETLGRVSPKCPTRHTYSQLLFSHAIHTIILHEYFHILNGHIDLDNHDDSKYVFELNNDNGRNNLKSQTIEMDADLCAINCGFTHLIRMMANKHLYSDEIKFLLESPRKLIYQWWIANHLLFRFFSFNTSLNIERLNNYTHPIPGIRQYFVSTMVYTLIQKNPYHRYNEICLETGRAVIKDGENILSKSIKKLLSPPTLRDAFNPQCYLHIYHMQDNWKTVRPLLEAYSYIKLAPIEALSYDSFVANSERMKTWGC